MSKKETALYACLNTCTVDVVNAHGEPEQRRFFAADLEDSDKLTEGGITASRTMLQVPKGEIVCKHFKPVNDVAEADRADQIANPGKYIQSERDLTLIAEFMVSEGLFRAEYKDIVDFRGNHKSVVAKTALDKARESIKELAGVDAENIVPVGANVQQALTVKRLLDLAETDKERRKLMLPVLKEAGVKIFAGADPVAMAERIFDEGLAGKLIQ